MKGGLCRALCGRTDPRGRRASCVPTDDEAAQAGRWCPGQGQAGGRRGARGQRQARATRGGQWPLCWAPLWGATCQPAEADDRVTAGDEGNAEVASAPRTRAEERAALRPLEVTGSRACEAGRRGLLRAPERVRLGPQRRDGAPGVLGPRGVGAAPGSVPHRDRGASSARRPSCAELCRTAPEAHWLEPGHVPQNGPCSPGW